MTTESTELIEEMLRGAQTAPEPGEVERIIHRGNADVPTPIVAHSLTSAGYVYVYDTETAERSTISRNMLPAQLRKKREDGTFVFSTKKPGFAPKRGAHKCLLHADNPNREHYDYLGLPTCRKANLTSPYQVTRHMQKRHSTEWATIEQERTERERQEDRNFQRSIMAKAVAETPANETGSFACDQCDATFDARIALEGHKRKHNKK